MAEEAPTIESQVQTAMRSRVSYFKEQSDSLTFEGVRRLLEKDLGLEKCALDVHKRVIKQLLLECIGGADDDNAPKNSGESESVGKPREETAESEHQLKKDVEDEKMEDSPVLGLMTGSKTSKNEKKETESIASEVPSENTIKKAVRARASYVRENSDKVTMAGLRRLLEKDLGLDEHTLDPYKKLISAQLDEALNSSEGSESPTEVEKKKVKKGAQIKSSEKGSSDENSDASGSESEEVEEEEEEKEKPRKKIIRKEKLQKSEPKKRKRPVKEAKVSSTKQVKLAKRMSVKKSAAEDSEHEDDNSQSSAENPVKKKEVPTSAYGKRVEHLKSVIKSCGMGVPPVIYKKVKQVSENKREAALIKELEEILSKEGLSANPSEKEIKEVRRRKERARELEGIDTSNIVSSSRRRSTTSFTAPPPKPKIPVESDHSGSSDSDDEDSDDGDDEDNEDDGDDEDNEDDGDEENGDSQSEEADDDNDEDSD